MDKVKVSAPATLSNIGPGFDLLGLALDTPSDVIVAEKIKEKKIEFILSSPFATIPADHRNVAYHVATQLHHTLQPAWGVRLILEKQIAPGSGLGGSAASSVAAAVAVNALADNPLSQKELLPFILAGEKLAAGSAHADNAAPSLLGGVCLCLNGDVMQLPVKNHFYWIAVHPHFILETRAMRAILPSDISLAAHTAQSGVLSLLIAGLLTGNAEWVAYGLHDAIVEPLRARHIPGFSVVRAAALAAGALGCSVSGSGPSLFAVADTKLRANKVLLAMQDAFFTTVNLKSDGYISKINKKGAQII